LKLRLLASKLGSEPLEEWVRHEAEGYPGNVELPDYRIHGMSFIGQFSGPFGSGLRNAPIPPYLIAQIAGDGWEHFNIRYSAAAVDNIVATGKGVTLDLSNLALLIQGKIYENMACNQLTGYVSDSAMLEVSNSIRNRILELTIALDRSLPNSSAVEVSDFTQNGELATQVFNQTVYGGITNIQNTGESQIVQIQIRQKDDKDLIDALLEVGLSKSDSEELGALISEEPLEDQGSGEPEFGQKVKGWLAERISNGTDAGIKGGITALVQIAKEAGLQYWGLK